MSKPNTADRPDRPAVGVSQNPEKRADRREEDTPERVPFDAVPPLAVDGLDHANFRYHWFNDENSELQQAQNAGYRFVPAESLSTPVDHYVNSTGDLGSMMCRGTSIGGKEIKTYLMAIPWAFYKENQKGERRLVQQQTERLDPKRQRTLEEAYAPDDKALFDKALAQRALARGT